MRPQSESRVRLSARVDKLSELLGSQISSDVLTGMQMGTHEAAQHRRQNKTTSMQEREATGEQHKL